VKSMTVHLSSGDSLYVAATDPAQAAKANELVEWFHDPRPGVITIETRFQTVHVQKRHVAYIQEQP
jgi:hypothetical protein